MQRARTQPPPQLGDLIREYSGRAGGSTELEIRFQKVDWSMFESVYESFRGEGELSQVISIIRGGSANSGQQASSIKEIHHEHGVVRLIREVQKAPQSRVRVPSGNNLEGYLVALSTETTVAELVVVPNGSRAIKNSEPIDNMALFRLKARASYPLVVETDQRRYEWRVDMTVVRTLDTKEAGKSLVTVRDKMFQTSPAMTADNLVEALGLGSAAIRHQYQFEVEVELMGPPDLKPLLQQQDVLTAAEEIIRRAYPGRPKAAAMQEVIARVSSRLGSNPGVTFRKMLPQVTSLSRTVYREIYPPVGYYVTDKADGVRAIAVASAGRVGIASTGGTYYGYAPAAAAASPAASPSATEETILDGELIVGPDGPHFYVFDAIMVDGVEVGRLDFAERFKRLGAGVEACRALGAPVSAKPYELIASKDPKAIEAQVQKLLTGRPYEVDGLILVEPGAPYAKTQTYKWKGEHDNTIDFLVRRAPASARTGGDFADKPGHELHFLFVGINEAMHRELGVQRCPGYGELFKDQGRRYEAYWPIQFAPSGTPLAYLYQHPAGAEPAELDGKIAEMRCLGGCAAAGRGGLVAWELVRLRTDRQQELGSAYFGNDVKTAEMVWLNYVDPFPLAQLWDGPANAYFMNDKPEQYRAQVAVTSYVKEERIKRLSHAEWVIDLGAGKGQDLRRYLDAQVRHLIAVDSDRAALSELVRRRFGTKMGRRPNGTGTVVHILAADLTRPYKETVEHFRHLGCSAADAVVCNLAAHYFFATPETLENFVALAAASVRDGGQVILTIMLGEAVHKLFTSTGVPVGGSWDLVEDGAKKFSLRRHYAGDKLEAAGQRVGVLLPFTAGAGGELTYYDEYLANTAALTASFARHGMALADKTCVADSINDFAARNRALGARLTPADRQYLALYGELVYHRKKGGGR